MRKEKDQIRRMLGEDRWREALPAIAALAGAVPSLLSFLPRGGELARRAGIALGLVVAGMAEKNPEAARNVVRQLMWRMNDDSGNIGWGVPQAFAEVLCQSPRLAGEYCRILFSYVMDLGHADNYCDNDLLRRSCYEAIGRFARCRPDLCGELVPWLRKGLSDRDARCRRLAARILEILRDARPDS